MSYVENASTNQIVVPKFAKQDKSTLSQVIKNKSIIEGQKKAAFITVVVPSLFTLFSIISIPVLGFTWLDFSLLVVMHIIVMFGVEMGFHRFFSHRSFKATNTLKYMLGIFGSMAAEGPLSYWVSNHRRHHVFHDSSGDPHSPYFKDDRPLYGLEGLIHSHVGWLFSSAPSNPLYFAKDLLKDPIINKINRLYPLWIIIGLLIPSIISGLVTLSLIGALKGFLWGGMVRIFLTHHLTWSVNSLCHKYGKQSFISGDRSTNLKWLSLPTLGGSLHNNHHAFPNSSNNALTKGQIDLGFLILKVFEKLGMAYKLNVPSTKTLHSKTL